LVAEPIGPKLQQELDQPFGEQLERLALRQHTMARLRRHGAHTAATRPTSTPAVTLTIVGQIWRSCTCGESGGKGGVGEGANGRDGLATETGWIRDRATPRAGF
jgi:hypothetical protein